MNTNDLEVERAVSAYRPIKIVIKTEMAYSKLLNELEDLAFSHPGHEAIECLIKQLQGADKL